jgi:uncharacterized protein (TIGR02391 family)
MARKPSAAPQPVPASLTAEQMRQGIVRLQRRIDELSKINLDALNEDNGDITLGAQVQKINAALVDTFGHNTIEYNNHSVEALSAMPMIFTTDSDLSFRARLPYIKSSVASAVASLQSAIDILKDRLGDTGETQPGRLLRAYEGLELHHEIARAASDLYRDGHYANAVEAAVKALNGLVRLRSGSEFDGTTLMERVFSPNNPVLKFNSLASQSDKDEQKGFMQMFSGGVSGLRNPRAHGFIHDDPERALEFIAFVSLLAKLLDETKR